MQPAILDLFVCFALTMAARQVGNTIGKRNRFLFLAFLVIEDFAMGSSAVIALLRLHQTHQGSAWGDADGVPWMVAFVIGDIFMMLGVTALMVTQASCAPSAGAVPFPFVLPGHISDLAGKLIKAS